jgi:hypothetical protein
MRRRDFIAVIGGSVALPLAVRAQRRAAGFLCYLRHRLNADHKVKLMAKGRGSVLQGL